MCGSLKMYTNREIHTATYSFACFNVEVVTHFTVGKNSKYTCVTRQTSLDIIRTHLLASVTFVRKY